MAVAVAAAQRPATRSMRDAGKADGVKKHKSETATSDSAHGGVSSAPSPISTSKASKRHTRAATTSVATSAAVEETMDAAGSVQKKTLQGGDHLPQRSAAMGQEDAQALQLQPPSQQTDEQPQPSHDQQPVDIAKDKGVQEYFNASEGQPASSSAKDQANEDKDQPAGKPIPPRRRESTRTRKPSSRLLPSPSPPPPRSSSYYSYLSKSATHGQSSAATLPNTGAKKGQGQQQGQAGVPYTSPIVPVAAGDTSVDSTTSDATTGPGKRKRRPSTMTKPPSTITQGLVETSHMVNGTVKVKARSSTKSQTPEAGDERSTSTPPSSKVSRKVKKEHGSSDTNKTSRAKHDAGNVSQSKAARVSSGYDSDGNAEGAMLMTLADHINDDGEGSDSGLASSKARPSHVSSIRKALASTTARSAVGRTVNALRAQVSLSNTVASEPPPLISRRGGLKGSSGINRNCFKTSHNNSQTTPPSSERWSWHRSTVSVPLLRFKLDNLAPRVDDEESSAADDEDDFHVAMLDGRNFDALSDTEDPLGTTSSVKSSPRASKSYDGSDVEDTPATTPQSPQSTCDGERRASADEEEASREATGKAIVHDAVFAHALEPSSTRPHTHAGALTLSLPFNEMQHPHDDDPSTMRSAGSALRSSNSPANVKGESVDVDAVDSSDAQDETDAAMAADLLGPATSSAIDVGHRQASMMLSSPNPGSAFASPNLATSQIVKSEPAPLALPPAMSSRASDNKAQTRLKTSTRFDSAHLSDEEDDDEEHTFDPVTLGMGPPESMCLSELEQAWEQGEYLNQARKMSGVSDVEAAENHSEDDVEQQLIQHHQSKQARPSVGKRAAEELNEDAKSKDSLPHSAKKTRTPSKTQNHPSPGTGRGPRRGVRQARARA